MVRKFLQRMQGSILLHNQYGGGGFVIGTVLHFSMRHHVVASFLVKQQLTLQRLPHPADAFFRKRLF